ncbi:LOB domain-containing protein 33-like [Actinidia eriantha]|uniref:LOB domain-containing protein 33-like n=1 Tax=Actinidia eriantha TaxID=165200 RepID=UPI00258C2227|nr:LOB domain-containing protein 33-like [Actinidia eriantha]
MIGIGSSCGACKFLRRRCTSDCVFAPYFCYDEAAAHFAAVHKVFGASNVSKLLSYLPVHSRSEAAISMSYEALARMQDPVYGCVAHILALQQEVAYLQEEIETIENQMANLAADASSFGSSQSTSQHDDMNVQAYLSAETLLFPHEVNASANHAVYTQMNTQLPTVFELEDQTSVVSSNSIPLGRLFEGIDQQIFASYPWM